MEAGAWWKMPVGTSSSRGAMESRLDLPQGKEENKERVLSRNPGGEFYAERGHQW